jgi:hypothetical protein
MQLEVLKRSMIEVGFTVENSGPPGKEKCFRATKGGQDKMFH